MNKKPYVKPVVTRVELKIKNAILATCNASPTIMDPKQGPVACSFTTGCYLGPGEG